MSSCFAVGILAYVLSTKQDICSNISGNVFRWSEKTRSCAILCNVECLRMALHLMMLDEDTFFLNV